MAEVLSQSEIDALLSALTSGDVKVEDMRGSGAAQKIRNYDFRRAMRFSKDHIRIISRIHEHFARLLTTHLSAQLRSMVQVQVESVDQLPYEEFVRSVPTLTVIQVYEFSPLEGKVAVEMNPQFVFAMLDRLMGGIVQGPYKERELTEIESVLLGRVLSGMTTFFAEAWRNITEIQPKLISVESNPQFLQLATPNDTVLVITLSARIGDASGLVNVCIPHVTIEPLMPKLSTQHLMDVAKSRHVSRENFKAMEGHLHNLFVNVAVQLGSAELTVSDVMGMQEGDIIPLHASIHEPVTVAVNSIPTFVANLGKNHGHYAVKIIGQWAEVNIDG